MSLSSTGILNCVKFAQNPEGEALVDFDEFPPDPFALVLKLVSAVTVTPNTFFFNLNKQIDFFRLDC